MRRAPFWFSTHTDQRAAGGFTLVELMITVLIAALLLTFAVPSFQRLVRSNQLASHTNTLLADLSLARSEAISRSERVVICSGVGNCRSGGDSDEWEDGWTIFVDRDDDAVIDTGATDDVVIKERDGLEGVSNPRTEGFNITQVVRGTPGYVAFGPSGGVADGVEQLLLRLCSASNEIDPNAIFVSPVGRARQVRDADNDGILEDPVTESDISRCP